MNRNLLIGLEGPRLTEWEKQALRDAPPLGVILFARNIEAPEQVRSLLGEARQAAGSELWAAIDEEGGRVHRMPWSPFHPRQPAGVHGRAFAHDPQTTIDAVYEDNLRVGKALAGLGFTHNCAPVLDIFHPEGHGIIGERAYGSDIGVVTALARACMQGLHDAGVDAVGKHFPGHGRANADSHLAVPVVDISTRVLLDEAQGFAGLIGDGLRHIMIAHVIYTQADACIATLSTFWLRDVLRTRLAFNGRIWSDDLSMRAASEKGAGDVPGAARAALAAGCDVLPVCQPDGVRAMYQALRSGMLESGR